MPATGPDGQSIRLRYDAAGQLAVVEAPQYREERTYNSAGQIVAAIGYRSGRPVVGQRCAYLFDGGPQVATELLGLDGRTLSSERTVLGREGELLARVSGSRSVRFEYAANSGRRSRPG